MGPVIPSHLQLSLAAKHGNLVAVAATVGIALAVLTMFGSPKPAHACSCASSGSPKEAMAEADAVFFGRVTGMTVRGKETGLISSADPVTVEFDVVRLWKGPPRETLTVETERMGVSCGFEFKEGRRYVVYAYDGHTGLCTRTAPIWLAARDFAALGLGNPPNSALETDATSEPIAVPSANEASRGSGCRMSARSETTPTDFVPVALLVGVIWLGAGRWRLPK